MTTIKSYFLKVEIDHLNFGFVTAQCVQQDRKLLVSLNGESIVLAEHVMTVYAHRIRGRIHLCLFHLEGWPERSRKPLRWVHLEQGTFSNQN